mmetsp:Transcript_8936/g.25240  ORF Transcript_8936/g.25240 Transcript_8936/m.25240 type:complete len:204 (-) Transcript_8936:399-1010(-)
MSRIQVRHDQNSPALRPTSMHRSRRSRTASLWLLVDWRLTVKTASLWRDVRDLAPLSSASGRRIVQQCWASSRIPIAPRACCRPAFSHTQERGTSCVFLLSAVPNSSLAVLPSAPTCRTRASHGLADLLPLSWQYARTRAPTSSGEACMLWPLPGPCARLRSKIAWMPPLFPTKVAISSAPMSPAPASRDASMASATSCPKPM